MSRNSTQIIRQWRLLNALEASRNGLSVSDLHDVVDEDCDPRTIYRDLLALESAGFPLQRDDETGRWRVLESREGGWVVPLEPTELIALAISESLLASTPGLHSPGSRRAWSGSSQGPLTWTPPW